MIKRTIIPGPPGTGKTYRLVNTYLKEEVEKYNTLLKEQGSLLLVKKLQEYQQLEQQNYLIKQIMMKT